MTIYLLNMSYGTDQSASNKTVPELHCMAQCKHGRSGDGDMIQCCLCFIWHHEDCVSTPVSKEDVWWVCPGCRTLSTSISTLTTVVVDMQDKLSKLFKINTALVASVDDLKHKNAILTAQVESLKPVTHADGSASQQPSRLPKLLIGDSTIRDVACTDPSSLYIVSRGGAKTGDTLQTLRKMKNNTFGDIIVHVGTNDCSTKFPRDKISDNIRSIVSEAKRVTKSGHITLSSITPSTDNEAAATKGEGINHDIKAIADENGCLFVCHQDNFLCRNGEINDDLLLIDGLHLSKQGTNRLIGNLNLQSVACCRIGRSQRPGGKAVPPAATNPVTQPAFQHSQQQATRVQRRHSDRGPAYHHAPSGDSHPRFSGGQPWHQNAWALRQNSNAGGHYNYTKNSDKYCKFCVDLECQ